MPSLYRLQAGLWFKPVAWQSLYRRRSLAVSVAFIKCTAATLLYNVGIYHSGINIKTPEIIQANLRVLLSEYAPHHMQTTISDFS